MKRSDRITGLRVLCVRDATDTPMAIVDCGKMAAEVARAFVPDGDEREHFIAIMLNARQQVKGVSVVSIGTLSASLVHQREVFRPAIVAGAAAIVVCHNHPSGHPTPSAEDRDVTRRLQHSGETLGIPIADHVIIGAGDSYFSFRERGLL